MGAGGCAAHPSAAWGAGRARPEGEGHRSGYCGVEHDRPLRARSRSHGDAGVSARCRCRRRWGDADAVAACRAVRSTCVCRSVRLPVRAASGRGALVIAFTWAMMEASLLFVVPDVWLGFVALYAPRRMLITFVAIILGAVAGGALLHLATPLLGVTLSRLLAALPGIGATDVDQARAELASQGVRAFLNGPVQGLPVKVYVHAAALDGLGLPDVLLGVALNRLERSGLRPRDGPRGRHRASSDRSMAARCAPPVRDGVGHVLRHLLGHSGLLSVRVAGNPGPRPPDPRARGSIRPLAPGTGPPPRTARSGRARRGRQTRHRARSRP